MIFDSHAHYDDKQFNKDREAVLKKIKETVGLVINIGANMDSSRKSIELAKKYDFIYTSIGVHPHDVGDMKEDDLERLTLMAAYDKVVGIGEIGLDYYYDHAPRAMQKLWFREQLTLAKELDLPVIIHSREATQETYDIIKESGIQDQAGVIHCFSGSPEIAQAYVDLGFYIGIGGVVTFKNAKKLDQVVQTVPLDRILVETDAPYLAPAPHRGKRNDSSYLPLVINKIAELKGLRPDQVEKTTYKNGQTLFFHHD